MVLRKRGTAACGHNVKVVTSRRLNSFLTLGNMHSSMTRIHSNTLLHVTYRSIGRTREIHNLDPQPHRHCMLASTASAPRVTRCSLGKYWSRDFFQKEAGWLPVLERVCISLVSLFRRRVFRSPRNFLSYNKDNGMFVILRISAFRISKFYCCNPSSSRITAG